MGVNMEKDNFLLIGIVVLTAIIFLGLFSFSGMFGGYHMRDYLGYNMMLGSFFMIIVFVFLVLLILWLFKELQNKKTKK